LVLFSVVSFQKYGFPKGILRNVTCIRVIAILTFIRQLCKPILHESKIKLHEFWANRQTFFSHITKYPLRKLEVFICQSSNYKLPTSPPGDQPQAIAELVKDFKEGNQFQTLLGVTGSGKTFTMANVIQELQKPMLVIAHNKTLAAQLYGEFKGMFPEKAVEYFVDKIGDYGRNNTRRMGGVCDLDSCNELYNMDEGYYLCGKNIMLYK
jgi:hypothetical protein